MLSTRRIAPQKASSSGPVNVVNVRCRFRQPIPQLDDCGIRLVPAFV